MSGLAAHCHVVTARVNTSCKNQGEHVLQMQERLKSMCDEGMPAHDLAASVVNVPQGANAGV